MQGATIVQIGRICGRPVPSRCEPTRAYISTSSSHPSKIALDIKVPLLRVRWTETPNGEEKKPEAALRLRSGKWVHPWFR